MKIALGLSLLLVLPLAFGQEGLSVIDIPDTLSSELSIPTTIDDSLVHKFISSIFSLDLVQKGFKDSLKAAVFEPKFFEHRQSVLSLGYEYGLLRGYIDPEATDPLQVFNVRGDVAVAVKNIPLLVSFNYSTWQNPLGVNNFFRITLDHSRFSNLNTDLKNQGQAFYDEQLKQVQSNRTDVLKKMNFGEVLMQKYKREMDQRKKEMLNYERELKKLELQEKANGYAGAQADSLGIDSKRDSLMQKYNQAKAHADKALMVYDSIQSVYSKAQEFLGYYNGLRSDLSNQKEEYINKFNTAKDQYSVENGQNMLNDKKKGLGIENIRNFELGLSYPKLSGLGTGGVPVQGLNLELEKNGWYYAICAGIMQNNLMMTTDATYNKFFNTQNLMNQFDFRNIRERSLITQVKFGRGTVESTHAHISVSYLSNALSSQFNQEQENMVPSMGIELDLKYVPKNNDNISFELIYGKSSRYETVESSGGVLSSLFSNDRTHAALARVTQRFEKLKTQMITSVRWIDPFADTRSYGVVQPNHMRIETRTIHNVSRNFRFGLNYRQDRGNIALPSDSTSQLHVGGFFVDAVVGEHLTFFGSANYVNFEQRTTQGAMNQVNYMLNGGIAASYKIFDTEHNLLINYGDNLITDTSSTGTFRTLNIQKSTKLRKGKNAFLLGYFFINDPALFESSSYIVGDEFSWNFKKMKLTGGLKVAYNEELDWTWGGKIELTYQVAQFAELFIGAEKLILGDFFNNYNRTLYDTFPFAFTTRINFLLK